MEKRIKIFAVVLTVLAVCSQPAMAREFADIFSECGIGAMIAPRNEAVAAVTNVTWDSGTTAISSNITSPDSCQGGLAKAATFIHQSYASLENDLSSGSGTYLDTLVSFTGYAGEGKAEFIAALRNDFAKVVADFNYSEKTAFEKSQALYNLVSPHIVNSVEVRS